MPDGLSMEGYQVEYQHYIIGREKWLCDEDAGDSREIKLGCCFQQEIALKKYNVSEDKQCYNQVCISGTRGKSI